TYYEPGHLGSSSCTKEDAEAWCLDVHTFTKYANEGFVFEAPVVIKEQFKDALDFDKARCAADLSDGLGNRELE
ncbi:hypothetical protein LTR74_018935, partial [Friedmanniomyces endolithicus]